MNSPHHFFVRRVNHYHPSDIGCFRTHCGPQNFPTRDTVGLSGSNTMSHPRYNDLDHSLAKHGSFGAVDLVARETDGKYFVKNVVHLCEMVQPLSRDDLYQFGSIVKMKHPNLARVREALIVGSSKTDKEDKMVIISDFIDGGMNLQNSIEIKRQRNEKFNNDGIMRILVQVLLGLKSLHDAGLVHGNLKTVQYFLKAWTRNEVTKRQGNITQIQTKAQ